MHGTKSLKKKAIKMSLGIFLSRLFIGDPWGDGTTFQIISCYLTMNINVLSYNVVVIYQASIWPEKSTINLVTVTFLACLSPCWNSSCYNVLTLRRLMSYIYIYIYIYDISSLKVNSLTLILLTWGKW